MKIEMKHYNVVAAIIINDGKILCVQKGKTAYNYISYKYEFPGGKIEENETPEQALERELKEELICDVKVGKHFMKVDYEYKDFSISLDTYFCSASSQEVTLKEHVAYKWLNNDELEDVDWAAADDVITAKLERYKIDRI